LESSGRLDADGARRWVRAPARRVKLTFAVDIAWSCAARLQARKTKTPDYRGFSLERMMGFEPTTFCMASESRLLPWVAVGCRNAGLGTL
jgi:hypothetical protein